MHIGRFPEINLLDTLFCIFIIVNVYCQEFRKSIVWLFSDYLFYLIQYYIRIVNSFAKYLQKIVYKHRAVITKIFIKFHNLPMVDKLFLTSQRVWILNLWKFCIWISLNSVNLLWYKIQKTISQNSHIEFILVNMILLIVYYHLFLMHHRSDIIVSIEIFLFCCVV